MSGDKTYQPYSGSTPCDIAAGRARGGEEPQQVAPIKNPPAYQKLLEQD